MLHRAFQKTTRNLPFAQGGLNGFLQTPQEVSDSRLYKEPFLSVKIALQCVRGVTDEGRQQRDGRSPAGETGSSARQEQQLRPNTKDKRTFMGLFPFLCKTLSVSDREGLFARWEDTRCCASRSSAGLSGTRPPGGGPFLATCPPDSLIKLLRPPPWTSEPTAMTPRKHLGP